MDTSNNSPTASPSAPHSHKQMKDFFKPGEPFLVTFPSDNGALAAVKDECYLMGKEPIVLYPDFYTPEEMEEVYNGTNPAGVIIIHTPRRASDETREKVATLMKDKNRVTVVTDSKISKGLEPQVFTDAGGHHAKF
jgi:hypothetical protein